MHLSRIEAVHFGALSGGSLEGLRPGLNAVLGPNEAGKSTYTVLVRSVLYGFETKSKPDAYLASSGGTRQGRLVLEDDRGRWVVERTAGTRGGPVEVRTLEGEDRPGLLEELTAGVSKHAFRVVFGFGVHELAELERPRGDDDIIGRLHAASAGLARSPQDVRKEIEDAYEALFLPKGRTQVIKELLDERADARRGLRDLVGAVERFTAERDRLADLAEALEEARGERDEAEDRRSRLSVAADRLERIERDRRELGEELDRLLGESEDLERSLEGAAPDEEVLSCSEGVERALEDLGAYRELVRRLEDAAADERGVRERMRREAEALDVDVEHLLDLECDEVANEGLQRRIDALRAQETRLEQAMERERTAKVAASRPAPEASRTPGWLSVAAAVFALLGLGLIALGVSAGSSGAGTLVIGALYAAGGFCLAAAGLFVLPKTRAAFAIDRSSGMDARSVLDQASTEVRAAELALARERESWAGWARDGGLGDVDVATARRRLAAAGRVQEMRERLDARIEAQRELERQAEEFERALESACGAFVEEPDTSTPDAVTELAEEARRRVREAKEADRRRRETREALERVTDEVERVRKRLESLDAEGSDIREELGLEDDASSISVRAMVERARSGAKEADERARSLADEHAELRKELELLTEGEDVALLRLRISTLEERIREASERYVVLASAARLLDLAQERYERERQPAVVRAAARHLHTMTAGRYTGVRIPLGGEEFEAILEDSESRTAELLSAGTADQLYLALRLGLIETLEGVGEHLPLLMDDVLVQFDPERARGAAESVAGLADGGRQVLLFTCHPHTVELLRDVEPEVNVLEIGRCD